MRKFGLDAFRFRQRLQLVRQTEASECGLACIVMIANFYGHGCELSSFRNRFQVSMKGATLRRLSEIASQLQFKCRALRIELTQLPRLRTPCILHWNMNHFVVLERVSTSGVVIFDPAYGVRSVSREETSRCFTGVALELIPGQGFSLNDAPPAIRMRDVAPKIVGLWGAASQVLLLSVALQVFTLLAPFLLQWVVDQVLVSADRDLLTVLGVGFLLAAFFQAALGLFRGLLVADASANIGTQWMANVFSHLLKLPMTFFERRHYGDIISKLNAVHVFQRTFSTAFLEALLDGLMGAITLILMLVYSKVLAAVSLLALLIYLAAKAATFRFVRRQSEQYLIADSKQQSHLLQTMRVMQSVKVSASEDFRRESWENHLVSAANHELAVSRMQVLLSFAGQLLFGVERVCVVWIGASFCLENELTVGMLIAYLAYRELFSSRVISFVDKFFEIRMLRMHGQRLADIVLAEPEPERPEHGRAQREQGALSIEVDGLGFRYSNDEPWILQGCSFSIGAGESVAIVGPSGCGKTTLVKLLLGLLKPTEGEIRVDGKPIAELSNGQFRHLIGAVLQDDGLFSGSIAENISFGDKVPDLSRIECAARIASIHDEVVAMPLGYYTNVGDMGSVLSGGQRQRVVFARALYKNPQLLVLDEATSHLDISKERVVNEAVQALSLTRIIVAHRPETIASADRVLEVREKRVFEIRSAARSVHESKGVSMVMCDTR